MGEQYTGWEFFLQANLIEVESGRIFDHNGQQKKHGY
jgi:hypothetical protein